MPLPIAPAIWIETPTGKISIPGNLLQPWFDSGEIKAIYDLLEAYTEVVVDPRIAASPGDKTYRHVQLTADTVWLVTHNLNKRTSVSVVDSGGTEVEGDVEYIDDNNVRLTFSAGFSGEAFFN